MQLRAQGLWLEAMFGHPIPEGALFYGETRRRKAVRVDADLRAPTVRIAAEARAMIVERRTRGPIHFRGCARCSMASLCRPTTLETPPSVRSWLERQIGA